MIIKWPLQWMSNGGSQATALTYQAKDSMGDAPDVHVNRTCLRFCNPSAFGDQCYWMFEDGAPCKHHFPDGIDQYADFKKIPASEQMPAYSLPDYCPEWDAPAVLPNPPNFPDQDWICECLHLKPSTSSTE